GEATPDNAGRMLVAVFASPVAEYLLRYAVDLGFRGVLLEPDEARMTGARGSGAEVVTGPPSELDGTADVVVTDHHRVELGTVLRDLLACEVRWIGIMGNPRHPGPHVRALTELAVSEPHTARVHR